MWYHCKWRALSIASGNWLCWWNGTDVNHRNKLDPFSFFLSILNQISVALPARLEECWALFLIWNSHQQPLLEVGVVILVKKENFKCLSIILESFVTNQGLHEPVHGFIKIGDQVARWHLFPPLHLSLVMHLVVINCVDIIKFFFKCCLLILLLPCYFQEADNVAWRCKYLRDRYACLLPQDFAVSCWPIWQKR